MIKTKPRKSIHGYWVSPWLFILAAGGFAVGLNSLWLFPAHLSLYGGGAFLAMYLIWVALLGIPLLMTEFMLDRLVRQSPIKSLRVLARQAHARPAWQALGALCVLIGFLMLTYYCVIGGWVLGVVTILSFNFWAFSFTLFGASRSLGFFDILQILTGHVLVVAAALLLAWFAAWKLRPELARDALRLHSPCTFDSWLWLNRPILPVLLIVLLYNIRLFL